MTHEPAPAVSFDAARLALARVTISPETGLRGALFEVARTAAAALRVGRVSVWRFLDARRRIRCEYLYEPDGHDVFEGTMLRVADFPRYFLALELRRVLPLSDVSLSAITEEFREPYLTPLGITAMLDAPLYVEGELRGIVCHEHTAAPREWTTDECGFAATVADTVARITEEARRMTAEDSAGEYHARATRLEQLGDLGRLAGGMAHDFGNILAAILGSAHLLETPCGGDADSALVLRELMAAGERGVALTRQLTQLGRAEARAPSVRDLPGLVRGCEPVLKMAAGPGVNLRVSTPQPVSRVFVDGVELERVLLNLVLNARDAMPAGGTIDISVFESVQARGHGHQGAFVGLEVRDSGAGMDAPTLERIFEPFFTTKGPNGTGLGLAIVQQVISLAGGFLEVESVEGHGTSVRVFLPAIGAAVGRSS